MLSQLSVVAYTPTPFSSSPAGDGLDPAVVAAVIGALATALVAALGFVQWRRGMAAQRQLERERLRAEQDRLAYEDQLTRARAIWEEDRRAAADRAAADEAAARRLRAAAEHADDLERAAVRYRRALLDELRALKILDMTRPLDLDALYVQVRVRQEEQRYLSREDVERITRGNPDDLLRLSAEHTVAKAADAIRPEDALRRYHRLVVVGDPGAGKTTMLKHLAFRAARGELSADLVMPIFVELRGFVDSRLDDLLHFAAERCERRYGFADAHEYLDQKLTAGHAVLLLDGIDEVLGGANADEAGRAYERVVAEIDRLAARYPAASIAVSCRRAGWRGGLPAFQALEVLDFDWEQIQRFLRNWFSDEPEKSDGLRAALADNVRMRTLAANPLILSLIAIVYERDLELPERRAELYRRCIQVLLQEWDAHRRIRRFSRFTTDRKQDLLRDLAWHFHRTGQRYFPEEDVLRLIGEFLPTVGLDAADARPILDEIAANYGLLKEQAHGLYGFLHLTLQEYFTATAVSERLAAVLPELIRSRHDPWWEEVLLLLAGQIDATPLLLGTLGHPITTPSVPAQRPLAVDDDLLHRDLFLAARCLVGTPRVTMPGLREAIADELWTLLDTSYETHLTTRAAQALIALGDRDIRARLVRVVVDGQSYFGSEGAVRAIGESMDPEFASALHANLRSPANDASWRAGWTIEVLGQLAHRPARQDLVMILRRYLDGNPTLMDGVQVDNRNQALSIIGEVVTAIGRIGGAGGVDEIQQLLQRRQPDLLRDACITALANVGDARVLEWLLANLDSPALADVLSLVRTCLRLTEPAQRPETLRRLLGGRSVIWGSDASAAVREFACPEFVAPLLDVLADEKADARTRWRAAEMLDDFEAAEPLLCRMVADAGRDGTGRAAAASTLAVRKQQDGRDHLIEVVGAPVQADWLDLRRCCDALVACGEDAWVRGRLLDQLAALPTEEGSTSQARRLFDALSRCDVSPVADRIQTEFNRLAPIFGVSGPYVLADLLCAPLVPYVLSAARWHRSWRLWEPLGAVATADQAAMVLAAAEPFMPPAFEALAELSQRHRLRMYADGRVLPLVPEPI